MDQKIFNYLYSFSKQSKTHDQVIHFLAVRLPHLVILATLVFLVVSKASFSEIKILLASLVLAFLGAFFFKIVFQFSRPFHQIVRTLSLYESEYSFPSEHATIFAALATVGHSFHGGFGIFLWIAAILIGFSRVVIGFHYPKDILFGWILGTIISLVCLTIFS